MVSIFTYLKRSEQIFRKKKYTQLSLRSCKEHVCPHCQRSRQLQDIPPPPPPKTDSRSLRINRFEVSKISGMDTHGLCLWKAGLSTARQREVLLTVRLFELFLPGSCGSSRRPHRTLDSSVIPIDLFMES